MERRIYICGNPIVDGDRMPFRILPELNRLFPDVEFMDFDPTENFPGDDPLYIVDTVVNTDHVVLMENAAMFERAPRVSVHDADLAFHLQLLAKTGKLPKFAVFGVPAAGDIDIIVKDLAAVIKKFIPT